MKYQVTVADNTVYRLVVTVPDDTAENDLEDVISDALSDDLLAFTSVIDRLPDGVELLDGELGIMEIVPIHGLTNPAPSPQSPIWPGEAA